LPPDSRQPFVWIGGETAALAHLKWYIETDQLPKYRGATESFAHGEHNPVNGGTRLSPWLAFGCITARLVVHKARSYEREHGKSSSTGKGSGKMGSTGARLHTELNFRDFWNVCKEEGIDEKEIAPLFRRIDLNKGGSVDPVEITSYALSQPKYGWAEMFNDWKFWIVLVGLLSEVPCRCIEVFTLLQAPAWTSIRFALKIYLAFPNFVLYYMTLRRRDHGSNHESEVLDSLINLMKRQRITKMEYSEFFELCALLGMNRYDIRSFWNGLDTDRSGCLSIEEIEAKANKTSQSKELMAYLGDWKMWSVLAIFISEVCRALALYIVEYKTELTQCRHILRFVTAFAVFRLDIIAIQGIMAKSPINKNGLIDALEAQWVQKENEPLGYDDFYRIAKSKGVKDAKMNQTFEKIDYNMTNTIGAEEIVFAQNYDASVDKSMHCTPLFYIALIKLVGQLLRITAILPFFVPALAWISFPGNFARYTLSAVWAMPKSWLKVKKCAWYSYSNSSEADVIDRILSHFDNYHAEIEKKGSTYQTFDVQSKSTSGSAV